MFYYDAADFGVFDGYAYYNEKYFLYYTDVYNYDTGSASYVAPKDYVYYYKAAPTNRYTANSGLSGYTYSTYYSYV